MKTLILSILAVLPFQISQGPAHPSPYCTTTSFPAPQGPIECPPGKEPNPICVQGCQDIYANLMASLYSEACTAYDQYALQYYRDKKAALDKRNECLTNGVLSAEECFNNWIEEQTLAFNTWVTAQASLNSFVIISTSAITDGYWTCVTNCCE